MLAARHDDGDDDEAGMEYVYGVSSLLLIELDRNSGGIVEYQTILFSEKIVTTQYSHLHLSESTKVKRSKYQEKISGIFLLLFQLKKLNSVHLTVGNLEKKFSLDGALNMLTTHCRGARLPSEKRDVCICL